MEIVVNRITPKKGTEAYSTLIEFWEKHYASFPIGNEWYPEGLCILCRGQGWLGHPAQESHPGVFRDLPCICPKGLANWASEPHPFEWWL